MDHEPHTPAPSARRTAGSRTPATPAPEVDFTPAQKRRIKVAAREAEASIAAAEAEAALLPQPAPETAALVPAPGPDAHGFEPSDYDWVPVRRKPRKDGWTPERQQRFIAMLAETGCVEHAAIEVNMSERSCYRLRRSPGAESFAAAWDVALQHASRKLLDVAFDRALRGTDEPVFDREGRRVGRRFRQNDRLMMFLLRAYMPDRFRLAHRDWRAPDEPLPDAPAPIERVLERLAPVPPAEPHRLMAPDALEDALQIAEIMPPGELPSWQRGRGDLDCDPLIPPPELDAAITRMIHGDGNDPLFDRIDGPAVRSR